jgi:hypothetical protein
MKSLNTPCQYERSRVLNRLTRRDEYGRATFALEITRKDIAYANTVQRLCEYEDAEEQGRLVELPIKPGEVVYCAFDSVSKVIERHIPSVSIDINGVITLYDDRGSKVATAESVGKTVFRSMAEARVALAEKLAGNNVRVEMREVYTQCGKDCYFFVEKSNNTRKGEPASMAIEDNA